MTDQERKAFKWAMIANIAVVICITVGVIFTVNWLFLLLLLAVHVIKSNDKEKNE